VQKVQKGAERRGKKEKRKERKKEKRCVKSKEEEVGYEKSTGLEIWIL
jgi:hypothetical protein